MIIILVAENVPKVEPGLPNGADPGAPPPAAAAAAAGADAVKQEPSLDLGNNPGLKLDQVAFTF